MTYTDQEKTAIITQYRQAGQSSNYVQNAASAHGRSTAGRRYTAQWFRTKNAPIPSKSMMHFFAELPN